LAGGSATVVGVAPPELDLPQGTDVWLGITPRATSTLATYEAFLRVRPGTSSAVVDAELESVMAGLSEADGAGSRLRAFQATRLVDSIVGDLAPILLIVLGGAGILLAIGCVNVATLVLSRGVAQRRELAIRKAVGASSAAVARHLLGESLVLSALGTALGVALAWLGVRAALAFGAEGLPRLEGVEFDGRVALFAVAALIVTTLLVGLLPALPLARLDLRGLLGEGAGTGAPGARGRRLLSAAIVAEMACAVTLVSGAGWLVRSYANLVSTDPGFTATGRLVFEPTLLGSAYMPVTGIVHGSNGPLWLPDRSGATPQTWLHDVTERLGAVEGVRAVALTSALPLRRDPDAVVAVAVPDEPYDPNTAARARLRSVSPSFFEALGVPMLAGGAFTDASPPSSVVVNEAFVRAFLADGEPIGATFAWGSPTVDFDNLQTIVGVATNVRYRSLREPAEPTLYRLGYPSRGTVIVSTTGPDAAAVSPSVRAAVGAVDGSIPITIEPLERILATELVRHRLGLLLMGLFAGASLVLAGIGIYGVVGHVLALRSGELALRAALGGARRDLVKSAVRGSPRLWLSGIALGLASAYVAGRLAGGWLVEVQASDPVILVFAAAAVSALALVAFLLPALRAASVQAAEVLRST
jgi:putative ABC transport system permease protein